ncbi:sporulation protein YqfD [Rubeoparvulum massiliense]|uniref:sporulation protein YqfD n=1 Tax=Rubeoparvulum massiliense TaxID=1631346 RepID=UPI00065E2A3B|nr:sporulation protein YqfD [Rubeoparvulum massiliense]
MWSERIIHWFKGSICVVVDGLYPERELNRLVMEGIPLWQVKRLSQRRLQFWMSRQDFSKLRRLRRRREVKIHIIKKQGVPFRLRALKRRNGIVIGALFFLISMYMLSQLVWKIEVEGNERISTPQVRQVAEELGIKQWEWIRRVNDVKRMELALREALPDVSWVGYTIEGTTVRITIVEKVRPEALPNQPQHLVATKKARVHRIIVTKGRAVINENTWVEPGDILISGYLPQGGIEGEGTGTEQLVMAEGNVMGEVWYEAEVEVPLTQQIQTFTGEKQKVTSLLLGDYQIGFHGQEDVPYDRFEKREESQFLNIFGWRIPLGMKKEVYWETQELQQERSVDEAIDLGKRQAKEQLNRAISGKGEILEEKILQQRVEGGKVTLRFLYVVMENIAKPKPIIP